MVVATLLFLLFVYIFQFFFSFHFSVVSFPGVIYIYIVKVIVRVQRNECEAELRRICKVFDFLPENKLSLSREEERDFRRSNTQLQGKRNKNGSAGKHRQKGGGRKTIYR